MTFLLYIAGAFALFVLLLIVRDAKGIRVNLYEIEGDVHPHAMREEELLSVISSRNYSSLFREVCLKVYNSKFNKKCELSEFNSVYHCDNCNGTSIYPHDEPNLKCRYCDN